MSERFASYLEREHARLEEAIAREKARPVPGQLQITRMKKLGLALRDQLAEIMMVGSERAA